MIRTLTLNGQPIELDSAMGWFYIYQDQFGHDILPDVMPLAEAIIAGAGEALTTMVEDNKGHKKISAEDALGLMNSDTIVDMFIKLAGMEMTTILNIFWAMRKNAEAKTPPPQKFVNSFDRLPIDELAPALLYIILDSSASRKNASGLLASIEKVIPSVLTPSPSPESTEG